MTTILRVKARWSGFSGAPGYSIFHFRDFNSTADDDSGAGASLAQPAAAKVQAFFLAMAPQLPTAVKVDVETDVEQIDAKNGQLLTVFTTGTNSQVAGTNTGVFSGATGAVINWRTAGVRNGRRVRGRTFLVPLASATFTNGGVYSGASRDFLQGEANKLASRTGAPTLGVWARPTTPEANDGAWFAVQAATVPNMLAILRSRRD